MSDTYELYSRDIKFLLIIGIAQNNNPALSNLTIFCFLFLLNQISYQIKCKIIYPYTLTGSTYQFKAVYY